jgi:hypothetical protein
MKEDKAFRLANEMLARFIQSQDIPPGGTGGSAASHGQKTGEFLAALHKSLYEYYSADLTPAGKRRDTGAKRRARP